MSYIIVKHAGKWEDYFTSDPKLGAHKSHSAHNTHTGKCCGIFPKYQTYIPAVWDCAAMNQHNPGGDYAVCPVIKAKK